MSQPNLPHHQQQQQKDGEQQQHEGKPQILPVPNPVISYWLSEPHKHHSLRSTPDLPTECEIAVIGSGMAGVLTAYHILKTFSNNTTTTSTNSNPTSASNFPKSKTNNNDDEDNGHRKTIPKILLLDARTLCSGATGRNGGHAKVKTATLLSFPDTSFRTSFQHLVFNVIAALKAIVDAEPGLAVECEFELRKSYDVFLDEEEAKDAMRGFEEARGRKEGWVEFVRVLGEDDDEGGRCGGDFEKETGVKGVKGGFEVPAASFWPYKLVTGLVGRMVERWGGEGGLNVQMNTPVVKIETKYADAGDDEDGGSTGGKGGGKKVGTLLTTRRGEVLAKKVVFATNAYTAGILPSYTDVIVPTRGMATHFPPPPPSSTPDSSLPSTTVPRPLTHTYNIAFPPDSNGEATGVDYLNPRPNNGIVVGGGSWYFRSDKSSWYNNFDDSTRFGADVEKYWVSYMQRVFHGWENTGVQSDYTWTGIQGKTCDGLPHVGRVVGEKGEWVDGQWVLAGFNGGGMAMIGVVSKAIAKMCVEDKGFEEVRQEFEIPVELGTSAQRGREMVRKENMEKGGDEGKEKKTFWNWIVKGGWIWR